MDTPEPRFRPRKAVHSIHCIPGDGSLSKEPVLTTGVNHSPFSHDEGAGRERRSVDGAGAASRGRWRKSPNHGLADWVWRFPA